MTSTEIMCINTGHMMEHVIRENKKTNIGYDVRMTSGEMVNRT